MHVSVQSGRSGAISARGICVRALRMDRHLSCARPSCPSHLLAPCARAQRGDRACAAHGAEP
jgi:hypothetical protein